MRIGELAELAGVSTRTVRHYHHLGLLPEPARLANGYRVYGLRDAVELARIRRLTELGLGLDEVRDVLADDRGRELREVLAELDADLARQEREIAARRARLAALLERETLDPDDPVSPEMAALLRGLTGPPTGLLAKERELLAMLDTVAGPAAGAALAAIAGPLAADPERAALVQALYTDLDALAGAAADDPRVPAVAARLADVIPPALAAGAPAQPADHPFTRALFAELAPAQAEAVRRAMRLLAERSADDPAT
ncbi:MerR family transcriptional regulator [Bailinhaonella thermotolerans]|uniref:MerR family transcriptional regulator n=1 Tax=Bailinhaonella thermotolerans TaxID=1070861 RepID=A0A3A4AXW6_9ACTN|nr:MerR family transcriptional regulator [Bailinhaonella thermotolerans]RJL30110.1 MerR family transcriptional regulator [Bailinhaonella thermotolerans]